MLLVGNNFLMDKFEIRRLNLDKLLREYCGGKIVNLAEKLGKSHSYVSRMLYPEGKANKKNIGDEMADEIARAFEIPRAYLESPIHDESLSNVELAPQLKSDLIPLISWVQAGAFSSIPEANVEKFVSTHLSHGEGTFALRVKGISMQNPKGPKSFDPDDIIVVDPTRPAVSGSLVVVMLDDENEATFKQLLIEDGQKVLVPLNPDWTPRFTEINGNATICGVVFQKIVEF